MTLEGTGQLAQNGIRKRSTGPEHGPDAAKAKWARGPAPTKGPEKVLHNRRQGPVRVNGFGWITSVTAKNSHIESY